MTKHYDKTYPGEHEAIIDKKTWDKAQELLAFNLTHSGKKDIRFSLLREIGSMLAKPEVIAGVMHQAAELDEHGKHLKLPMVQQAFDDLTNVGDVMFPVERYKFINEVVEKITVHLDRVEIEYKTDGLEAVITETENANGKNN